MKHNDTHSSRDLGGIRDLPGLMARCHVDVCTGCWHWRLAFSQGSPKVRIVMDDGTVIAGRGRRMALTLKTGMPLPASQQAFPIDTCESPDCVNPDHCKAGSRKQRGAAERRTGRARSEAKTRACRVTGAAKRKLTAEQVIAARASEETDTALSRRLGVSRYCVWAARNHKTHRHLPPAATSVFTFRP